MTEQETPTESSSSKNLEDKISKTMALVILAICLFSGFLGYAFGADAGYAKAMDDCRHLPVPEVIVSP